MKPFNAVVTNKNGQVIKIPFKAVDLAQAEIKAQASPLKYVGTIIVEPANKHK